MTDNEWGTIAAMMITAWPSARWPEETQAFYRQKLDRCNATQLASVIDKLSETEEFLPALSKILKEFAKRTPQITGANQEYGTLAYFERFYPERAKEEYAAFLEYRNSQRARLEDRRSGLNGPQRISPGSGDLQ